MSELTALFEAALLLPHKTHVAPAMCQIAQELSRGIGLGLDLGMAVLCLLSPEGSLYGLAAPHPRDPSALLAPWVVEVILSQHSELRAEAGLAPADVPRIGQALTRLLRARAREAKWAPVLTPAGLPSHGVLLHENPVLYAHWLMGHSDVAEHLAVVTQQAVVARLNQLEGQEAEARALHMRKFLGVPARIACQLTAEDLAPDEGDGTPPDLLHIGWKAMRQFGNYSSLSVSTRETYEDNWQAFVLSSPASKKFRSHASPPPRPDGGAGRPKARPIRPSIRPAGRPKASTPAKMTTPEESEFMAQPEVQAYMADNLRG